MTTWTTQDQQQFDMILSGSTASCEDEKRKDAECLTKVKAILQRREAIIEQLNSVKTWAEVAKYDTAAFGALELSIKHLQELVR